MIVLFSVVAGFGHQIMTLIGPYVFFMIIIAGTDCRYCLIVNLQLYEVAIVFLRQSLGTFMVFALNNA